ncbi:outer membrane protein assembly factor BamA [Candidatus Pelagibacter sp. HIMB1715]|uniref:outer membrane protein assembly factor BamA n=1 Tax=Candidatus Pelagibacter sp. HIMB1715 TaxID=3413369 RepID=UPI003F832AFF
MNIKNFKLFLYLFFLLFINFKICFANEVKKILIEGNQRISSDTIIIFSGVSINDNVNKNDLNKILKDLYSTNFFENIKITLDDNLLKISVIEYPIIENIKYQGLKADKILEQLKSNSLIKMRSSYNEIDLKNEKKILLKTLKEIGYYNADLEIYVEEKKNKLVNLIYNFNLGDKAKISKITFLGNKIFKDNKLRRIIVSSEYKYWKFLTGRKYLNENLVNFDKRLLTNFYKNNGFYNVSVNSSFAKMIKDNEFELIFNIDANPKVFFGNLSLSLPLDFDENNFKKINKLFDKLKGKPYSINKINDILDQIDLVASNQQYQFIDVSVNEILDNNILNLEFVISETEKYFIKKINIFGNNITAENVIRNNFEVDEGDPFSEILVNKSINNLKSLNFFKNVNKEITVDEVEKLKSINIFIEEKPTGEIFASAGVGTDGNSVGFGIKENNFLGRGVKFDSNISVSSEKLKGKFSFTNPNYKNLDKSLFTSIEAQEIDNLKSTGYKTNKTGFSIGTNFEYYDNLNLGIGTSNFYEKISTNSTASARQKAQEGDYWDTILNINFNYDRRNQKFQTSSGFKSFYSIGLPVISENYTFKNYYSHTHYFNLFEKNISTFSLYFETANSLTNKDVKLSERIKIPSNKLRGFENGRVGPKDGSDHIGGNYAYSLNFTSTIPQLFEESQNIDFKFFTDIADIWGVDYDSSLNKNEIRSSIGIGLDWLSPVGPMNFSLAQPLSKADGDKTESFRFNLGTTF